MNYELYPCGVYETINYEELYSALQRSVGPTQDRSLAVAEKELSELEINRSGPWRQVQCQRESIPE